MEPAELDEPMDAEMKALMAEMKIAFGDEPEPRPSPRRSRSSDGKRDARTSLRKLLQHVPHELVRRYETVDVPAYRLEAVIEIERRLFGWEDRHFFPAGRTAPRPVTPVMVTLRYREALTRERRAQTLRQVGWVLDAVRHAAQVRNLEHHETPDAIPEFQMAKAMSFATGIIEVRDVERPDPTCGVRSFIEATPIELVTYTFDVHAECGPSRSRSLRVWDVTAGSGTVSDVASFYDAEVVATDLNFETHAIKFMSFQDAGKPPWHLRVSKTSPETFAPTKGVVANPDLVFIDPGSRGSPSVSELYFKAHDPREICGFGRDEYIDQIVEVLRVAIGRLAHGGLVSFVVREGVRANQQMVPDPGLADEILRRLGDVAYVVERLGVVYVDAVRQVSLGMKRVPTVHLLLARADA